MIYGEMDQFRGGFCNCPALKKALDFLVEKAPGLEDGRHELEDGMYALIKHYSPGPASEKRYETHIKYADVQVVLEGSETLYNTPLDDDLLRNVTEDRLEANDVRFHAEPPPGPEVGFKLRPGLFTLLLPNDVHKPECFDGSKDCRKAIVKIPMTLLKF